MAPLSVDQVGTLMAYAVQGHPFEHYAERQAIPEEDMAEARELYDDTVATSKSAAAAGGEVRPVSDWG